jgi:hypothetical protein
MSEQAWTDSYRDDYEDLLLSQDTPENDDADGQPEIVVGNNTIKCVRISAADDLISIENPTIQLSLAGDQYEALLDYGACANFVDMGIVTDLIKQRKIKREDLVQIKPITVIYGNGEKTSCDCYFVTTCGLDFQGGRIDAGQKPLKFLVSAKSDPPVILGRTGLKNLGFELVNPSLSKSLRIPDPDFVLIEKSPNEKGSRLTARIHYLESAAVSPFHESKRRRSLTDQRLIYHVLLGLERRGQIERVDIQSCTCILEVVLVDKFPAKPRSFPCEDLHKRYRLTLDCRPLNKMRLIKMGDGYQFVPQLTEQSESDVKTAQKQFQLGALQLLQTTDLTSRRYFAKLDISSAFNSILVSPSLGRLMNVQVTNDNGENICFSWRCLPQGFRLSPLLFNYAMQFLISKLDKTNFSIIHFQDDVIIGANTRETCETKLKECIAHFSNHGFSINPDKISSVSESCIFCGYEIAHGSVKPRPKRQPENVGFSVLWSDFEDARKAEDRDNMKKWFRSNLGRIQYFSRWFPPDMQIRLSEQYQYLKFLHDDSNSLTRFDEGTMARIKSTFVELYDAASSSLSPLFTKSVNLSSFKGTLIATDANKNAWCGIIFRIIDLSVDNSVSAGNETDTLRSWVAELSKVTDITDLDLNERCTIVPLGYYGKSWSMADRKKSSTHLERLAQLFTIDQGREHLHFPVLMINDNQNTVKEWCNIEDYFGAEEIKLFHYMRSQVTHCFWFPRTSDICRLVDRGARIIDEKENVATVAAIMTSDDRQGNSDAETEIPALVDLDRGLLSEPTVILNGSVLSDLIRGYTEDDVTTYCGVKLKDIYAVLKTKNYGSTEVETKSPQETDNIARRFILHANGLLTYDSQRNRIVLPRHSSNHLIRGRSVSFRSAVLYFYHDMSCHIGVGKLMRKINGLYWWPNFTNDVLRYVRSCKKCCLIKGSPDNSGVIGSTMIGETAFSIIVIDFAVVHGQNVLVVVDSHSNYVVFIDSASQTARDTAACIWREIICVFGAPRLIHSDLGSSFINEVITELKAFLKIEKGLDVNPYSPRTQGLAERFVGTLKRFLSLLESFNVDDFRLHLKFVQLICNTSMSPVNVIPFELVFGRPAPDLWRFDFALPSMHWPFEDMRDIMSASRQHLQERTRDSALAGSKMSFSPGDRVIRYIKVSKPGSMKSVPHPNKILSLSHAVGRGQWIAYDDDGVVYKVPEYQLKRIEDSNDLRVNLPSDVDDPILFHPFQIGEYLIVEEVIDEDWSYGVYKLISVVQGDEDKISVVQGDKDKLVCSKLWWTSPKPSAQPIWKEYPDEPLETILPNRVIANRVALKNGRISQSLFKRLKGFTK